MCGGVAVLKELDVSKIPRSAVLYTDLPLRTAALIKLKAPWVAVRIGGIVKVVDVQLFELEPTATPLTPVSPYGAAGTSQQG